MTYTEISFSLNIFPRFVFNIIKCSDCDSFMVQGVLIVGERGTGKTSLALAIAAEAKVPVVEVKAQQLEAGLWVGQSASNVRELFQTARDLVCPLNPVDHFHYSYKMDGWPRK